MTEQGVVEWLLDSDPAIRWQVMRDLVGASSEAVAVERARVTTEGWGAELLALQTPDGHWGDDQKHGWMPTTDALFLLRALGVDPGDERVRRAVGCVEERIFWWQLDGHPFFEGETEACINGRTLAAGAYFGAPCERLAERLLGEQLTDGGWNCEAPPSTRSSFHSTICVLEGLLAYEEQVGATPALTEARRRGENYLLARRLLRRLSTGAIVDDHWTRFSFPTLWHYDVLRALDYFRRAGAAPDARGAEAAVLVEGKRLPDGRWPLDLLHADRARIPFQMEEELGAPSRWITLLALRVLQWYRNGRTQADTAEGNRSPAPRG